MGCPGVQRALVCNLNALLAHHNALRPCAAPTGYCGTPAHMPPLLGHAMCLRYALPCSQLGALLSHACDVQVLEMLKMLLDPDTLEGSAGGYNAAMAGWVFVLRGMCYAFELIKFTNLRFSTWVPLPGAEKDKFVELFYDRHISQLLAALVAAGDTPYGPGAPAASTGAWRWPVLQWAATERMG